MINEKHLRLYEQLIFLKYNQYNFNIETMKQKINWLIGLNSDILEVTVLINTNKPIKTILKDLINFSMDQYIKFLINESNQKIKLMIYH